NSRLREVTRAVDRPGADSSTPPPGAEASPFVGSKTIEIARAAKVSSRQLLVSQPDFFRNRREHVETPELPPDVLCCSVHSDNRPNGAGTDRPLFYRIQIQRSQDTRHRPGRKQYARAVSAGHRRMAAGGRRLDPAAGKIYWTNGTFGAGTARRANLGGSNNELLPSG